MDFIVNKTDGTPAFTADIEFNAADYIGYPETLYNEWLEKKRLEDPNYEHDLQEMNFENHFSDHTEDENHFARQIKLSLSIGARLKACRSSFSAFIEGAFLL